MDDKLHELYQRVKELAIELGETPSLVQMEANGISRRAIDKAGGSTAVTQACGLEVRKKRKIDNKIFEKCIDQQIENFIPKEKHKQVFETTVILGDTHFPFIHQPSLDKAYKIIEELQPKYVIQIGDLYDMFSHGKFPRSHNIYTPKDEMVNARTAADKMWKHIKTISKNSICHQILGNHDIRPIKRVIEQYPEAELFFDFEKWFKFEGVNLHMDIRQEVIINGICFIHGFRSNLGAHRDHNKMSTVCGHSHLGGVNFKSYGDEILFELNAGYLGDPESKALSYTPQKITNWTHGVGVIDKFGPRFINF